MARRQKWLVMLNLICSGWFERILKKSQVTFPQHPFHIVGLTRICRFSPRIQQFSSRFRRELLNSLRESSNSRQMFSNSRRRIRRELLILQKITTNREKRKVNLVATENWTILCCDENSYSRWDENWPILCCEENSNSRRDEICPILCCEENSNSRRDEICPVLCCDENSNSRWDENCPILCCDEICPILYNLENMYQAVRGVFFLYYELAMLW